MDSGTATPSGISFGPNRSGKTYLSLYIHRGTRAQKHQWSVNVSPSREYDIFCSADEGNWKDTQGHYWGVYAGGQTVLGSRGERLCKFPRTSNIEDPWHGYPVSPMEEGDKDAPPDDFVENWIATRIVSKTFGRRIQRRKI